MDGSIQRSKRPRARERREKGGGVRRERDSRRTSTSFYGATDGIVMTLTPPGSSSSYLDGKLYMFIHLAIAASSRLSSTIVCHGYIILVY